MFLRLWGRWGSRHQASMAAGWRDEDARVPLHGTNRVAPSVSSPSRASSACIDKNPVGGPQAHHDVHRCATRWAQGDTWWRGCAPHRLAIAGLALHDHQADGREWEGTAGMEKAEVADFPQAIGQDVLEEPPEKLHAVEVGGAEACTAHFPVREGDGTVREAHETVVGDGDLEDIRGEVGEGGVAVVVGLTVDIPGDGPDLGGDVLQQSSLAHLFFEKRTVDR